MYLDISQVESANWSLSPWLLDYEVDGVIRLRDGNRHAHACPHGAFPCADEGDVGDRWVAIACWTDDAVGGARADSSASTTTRLASLAARKAREDEIEALVSAWTATRTRAEVAEQLQAAGIEAVPVEDFGDLHDDPQLALREHFEPHTHPFLGPGLYERNGFRLSDAPERLRPGRARRSARTTTGCCATCSGCTDAEIEAMKASGAVE